MEKTSALKEQIKQAAGLTIYQRGQDYLASGRIEAWHLRGPRSIEGVVGGQGSARYNTVVHFYEDDIISNCTCPYDWTRICKHAVALALAYEDSRQDDETPEVPQSSGTRAAPIWATSLGELVATAPAQNAAIGRYRIIFRLTIDKSNDRPSLIVRTNRARMGRGGKGVEEPFRFNPAGTQDLSPQEAAILTLARSSPHDPHSYLSRVDNKCINVLLTLLADEDYVYVEETDAPVEISPEPVPLHVKLERAGEAHIVTAELVDEGWRDTINLQVLGERQPWVTDGRRFAPLETDLSGSALAGVVPKPIRIEAGDWPHFVSHYLEPLLDKTEPVVEDDAIGEIRTDILPRPILNLVDRSSTLTLSASFAYGEGRAAVSPTSTATLIEVSEDGGLILAKRQRDSESAAIRQLEDCGIVLDQGTGLLTGQNAIAFLADRLPELQEAGWKTVGETPNWRINRNRPQAQAEVDKRIDWFDLKVRLDYGGTAVDIAEALAAYRAGHRFIQLADGSWGTLPSAWLEERLGPLEELQEKSDYEDLKVRPCDVPLAEQILREIEVVEAGPDWRRLADAFSNWDDLKPAETPIELQGKLRDYQCYGLSWLQFLNTFNFGGILADDMGLGKTIQTIALLLIEHREKVAPFPSLIVAPSSVAYNWEVELSRFAPALRILKLTGPQRHHRLHDIDEADIVITTYPLLRRDVEVLGERRWHYLVLDEAQFIKNPTSATAQAACSVRAAHRLALTGTPIENNLRELWSIFNFLMPELLGPYIRFREEYEKPIAERNTAALGLLTDRLRPFMLRRTKGEVARDLPPKTETIRYCTMTKTQSTLYQQTLNRYRAQVMELVDNQGINRSQITVLDALLKLRQICCHPQLLKLPGEPVTESGKMDAWSEMIRELVDEGHRALVFSQFTQMLKLLTVWLDQQGIEYCYLDGSTKDRGRVIDSFNEGDAPLFLISLKAGGFGLNLTGADYVIHYDPWWNPAAEAQATDRAHRIGQEKHVFAYKLITRDSIEEKVLELQKRKQALFDDVLDTSIQSGRGLSKDDLEFLLA